MTNPTLLKLCGNSDYLMLRPVTRENAGKRKNFFAVSPVDVRLPFQAEMFIQNVILVFFCVGMIAGVFPWFLVAVGPLVILFSILHIVSR